MPFEWFLALRFLREGRLQSLLILAGVAVGVAVIVFLSALIEGLQASLIDQTLGSQAHVIVRPQEEQARVLGSTDAAVTLRRESAPQRRELIDQWQPLLELIGAEPGVVAVSPLVSGPAFASRGAALEAVTLNGVVPASFDRVIRVSEGIVSGSFELSGEDVVIGGELAEDLGVAVGDRIRLDGGEERSGDFRVSGIFDLGSSELNERWVFVALRSGQSLLDAGNSISTIDLRVRDVFSAGAIATRIAERTGLVAEPWTELNAQLLVALRSQSASSFIIRFFITVAVALGIASVLTVSVVQKSSEIGILKALGTSTERVRRVFVIQGGLVGLIGSGLGSLAGAALALFFSRIAQTPAGEPTFPIDLSPQRFLIAALVATLTGLLAAAAPASRAARLDPAKVIRRG
ncbi:MAG: ABC transporter permease [Myxococcales bacterium]|jgi:lipoprotein-releasing system permease protein